MQLIKINDTTLSVPDNMSEMKACQYIDFIKALQKCNFNNDVHNNIYEYAKCLCAFWGVHISIFQNSEVVVDSATNELLKNDENELSMFIDLNYLVNKINNLINDYTPVEIKEFYYKGKKFDIPHYKASDYVDIYLRPTIQWNSFIDLLEAKRLIEQNCGKDKDGNDKDPDGSYSFSELLHTIAHISSNEDIDKMEIDEKILYFKDIDVKTCLDVAFFLSGIVMKSKWITAIDFSLIHPN